MEEAGFDENQSRTLITIWSSIVELNLATKDDYLLLKKDLEIAFLRERKATDDKFSGLDEKFIEIDKRFIKIEKRLDAVEESIKHLPGKLLNQFIFVAFAMVSSMVALGKLGIL